MASSSYQAKHLSNKATSCSFHGWHPFFRENARMAWRAGKQREDARQTACSPKSCKPLNEPPLWYQMERHRRQINIRQHQIEPRSSNRTPPCHRIESNRARRWQIEPRCCRNEPSFKAGGAAALQAMKQMHPNHPTVPPP
jgi:hypothetical protein